MDDIYRSQANVYRDTFSNPLNSANMNPGWGINPALMTPSYDAPYRPQYMGPSGYTPYGNPGFFKGAYNAFGPAKDPYWGNPTDNVQASVNSMASRPFDAMAWGMQNIALPYAGYTGMAKILSPSSSSLWGMAKGAFRGQGIAAGVGYGLGSGAASTFTSHAGARAIAGGIGGVLGAGTIPFAAGYAATQALDSAFITPYTNSRLNANNLQNNFSNAYFSENVGNSVTGKGLGGFQSHRMGSEIMHQGLGDMMFSRDQYAQIADMTGRSGMLDNTKASQITQKIKDVAEQIKLIVSISKDPDIKTAIEELSKLNLAGASTFGGRFSAAGSAYSTMGGYAAGAGTSIQKLMNTVGAQGQYLYQSNGMTPYLGQLAAGNSYMGFAAAKRTGLISDAQMSRMGGLDGATQASLTAQVIGSQTPFNMMGAYNQFIGGRGGASAGLGQGQNVVNTISAFGESVSRNPTQAVGAMALYGRAAAGAGMAQQGNAGLEQQAVAILRNINESPMGKGGKFSPEQLAAALQSIGVPEDQIIAYMHSRAADVDPSTYRQKLNGLNGQVREQTRSYISQNGLGGGILDRTAHAAALMGQSVGSYAAREMIDPVTGMVGSAIDTINKGADTWGFGKSIKDGWVVEDADKVFSSKASKVKDKYRSFDMSSKSALDSQSSWGTGDIDVGRSLKAIVDKGVMTSSDATSFMEKVNELAKAGNEEARAYLSAESPKERSAALGKLVSKHGSALGRSFDLLSKQSSISGFKDSHLDDNLSFLESQVSRTGRLETTVTSNAMSKLTKGIQNSLGGKEGNNLGSLHTIGAVQDLYSKMMAKTGAISEEEAVSMIRSDPKYAGILEQAGGPDASDSDIKKALRSIFTNAGVNGTYGLGSDVFNSGKSRSDIAKMSASDQQDSVAGFIKKRGNRAGDAKIINAANMGVREQFEQQNIANSLDSSFKQAASAYHNNEVSYDQMISDFKGLDGVDKFGLAVDKFGKNVDKMATSNSSSPLSFPAWLNRNTKTQTPNGNGQ